MRTGPLTPLTVTDADPELIPPLIRACVSIDRTTSHVNSGPVLANSPPAFSWLKMHYIISHVSKVDMHHFRRNK